MTQTIKWVATFFTIGFFLLTAVTSASAFDTAVLGTAAQTNLSGPDGGTCMVAGTNPRGGFAVIMVKGGTRAPGRSYYQTATTYQFPGPIEISNFEACGYVDVNIISQNGANFGNSALDDYLGVVWRARESAGGDLSEYEFALSGLTNTQLIQTKTFVSAGSPDTTPPVPALVSIVSGDNGVQILTFRLSEVSTDFTADDFALANATVSLAGSGRDYVATVTPTAFGEFSAQIKANSFSDAAGNFNTRAGGELFFNYAAPAPTATIGSLAAFNNIVVPKGGVIQDIAINLSEASTDFTVDDIEAVNATVTLSQVRPDFHLATLTPVADGVASIQVKANSFSNAAGTFNTAASNKEMVTADVTTPTAEVFNFKGPNEEGAYLASISLSELPADGSFTVDDLEVTNGTVTLMGSGISFQAWVTPNAGAPEITLQIKAGSFTDAAGNSNEVASNKITLAFDSTPPTATLSPFNGPFSGVFRAGINLSEVSTDFTADDLTVTNGTVTLSGSGTAYQASVTPVADGDVTLQINTGSFSDAAGNVNTEASNTISINADLTPPTATIAAFEGPDADGQYSAVITLSESSDVFVGEGQLAPSFTAEDLLVVNGTATLSGSGTRFTALVTPGPGQEIRLRVNRESFSDSSGNLNADTSNTVRTLLDTTPPTATISPFSGPFSGVFRAAITLSEVSANFTAADLSVTNGTVTLTGSGTAYQASVTPAADGDVTLQIKSESFSDAAGNVNAEASNTVTTTFDSTPPTATIAAFKGPTDGKYTAVITLSEEAVEFFGEGEPVLSLSLDALMVTNGTVTLTGSGKGYTATVTPLVDGEVTLQVKVSSFQDAAGNKNTEASNTVTAIFDSTPPTASISPFTGPFDGEYKAAITLSEVSSNFTAADLNATNGTVTLSGSGTAYQATFTPTADGDIALQVKSGSFSDAAGNANSDTSNTVTATFDSTPPTATIAALKGPKDGKYTAVITLSEEAVEFVGEGQQVPSFTVEDLTVTNGTVTLSGSGQTYTAAVTPSMDGEITLQVKVSSFQDAAGNKNVEASNMVKITFDGTPPTAAIAALEGPTDGKFTAAITLSESASDFTVDDLVLTNATATLTGSGTAYIVTLTPIEDGEIAALIKVGSFSDAAGNLNADASNRASVDFDGTPPAVVLSGQPDEIRDASEFTINVTFSEEITGFVASDITVENGSATVLAGSSPNFVATITPTGGGDVSISVDAGVAQDLANNLNTASNTIIVKNMIAEITQKLIANATVSRAINLIANQPNLTRFMTESVESGDLDANVTQGQGIISFRNNPDNPVWMQGHGSWSKDNDTKTKYAFGAMGKHMRLGENTLLGAMAQVDYAKSVDGVQNHESFGWLVGPYIVAKVPDQPLYFEGSALVGKTDNDVNPIGSYTDTYDSNRWILNGKVTGQIKQKGYTLEPNINVNYVQDITDSYTDKLGNDILGAKVEVAQVSVDLDARIPMKVENGRMDFMLGGAGVFSDVSGSGGAANISSGFEGERARLDAGIDRRWDKSSLMITGFYDGIGADRYESYGVNVRVTTVF